jgi:endonuclease YncB( thermonuclease family)
MPFDSDNNKVPVEILYKFIIILLFIISFSSYAGEMFEGRVVGVHDGDTVTLLMAGDRQLKVRLAQIDAPELDQAFGQQSKQSLSEMIFNKTIKVEKETIDKYGRTVGTLFVEGLDANEEQIKRGMAWVYRKYLHDQSLLPLEEVARQAKAGLWADANPMAPWDYRHGGKQKKARDTLIAPREPKAHQENNAACGSKHYCKEMASCEEAKFYLNQCGLTRIDGDGDGIPCEKLCRPTSTK